MSHISSSPSSPSNWSLLPEDLYGRYQKDRILTVLFGLGKFYESVTQISRWKPEDVDPVERVIKGIVARKEVVADDVVALTLKDEHGGLFPIWNPGAHIDLILPSGRRRQYSLSGNPVKRTEYRIAVRRIADGGGGSIEVHDEINEGDTIFFEGPNNAFHFSTSQGKVLFVIGGIGITPILPMIKTAHTRKLDWYAVYAGRSRSAMPFIDELVALDEQRVTIWCDDEKGMRASAEDLLAQADDITPVYVCGPTPMLTAVLEQRQSLPDAPLHYERFSPPPVINEQPFILELAQSGITLEVPDNRSALDVMLDVNPNFPHSCRQGFCGTCKVKVLSGEVKHRAKGREADGEMLVCMSRAEGDKLIIDA